MTNRYKEIDLIQNVLEEENTGYGIVMIFKRNMGLMELWSQ